MEKINIKILGYYGKGNFGDDLLYTSLVEILDKIGVSYSKSIENGAMLSFSYINKLFNSDHQISIGGLLQTVSSFRSFHYYITMLNLARSNILFGQSFGPFKGLKYCLSTMKKIKGLTGVLLRDLESYRVACKLWGNENIDIEYGSDIVFNLDISKYISKIDSEKYALIVIKRNENRKRVSELIAYLKKYLNIKIIITVFDEKDREEFKTIKHAFYEDTMVRFEFPSTLKEAINLVYNSKYVFSWRLHPLILAIMFEKPFGNMSFSKKNINFLSPYTLPVIKDEGEGFKFIFKKLDVKKLRISYSKLSERNIDFLKRNLNNNIFNKKLPIKNDLET
jgi:polysaccharide pyruvyl transferase WcaK-like protein